MSYEFYRGRRVMITGGLGFIGSNLARRLVELGADLLLVDSLIPDYGGNLFNIAGIEDRVRINIADVRQASTMNYLVRGREIIFNIAGQVSHIDSMRDPHTDLDINCRSQLTLLEACRHHNPARQGDLREHAADLRQAGVSAGHRAASGSTDRRQRHQQSRRRVLPSRLQQRVWRARDALRLTNIYGPRQLLKHNRQGFIAWFIRLALEDREIQIFGDGTQVRDFVYVDDAVDAFLRAGAATHATARSSTSAATSTWRIASWSSC